AFGAWTDAGRCEPLNKKPVTPTDAEATDNPRSRSAKLRGVRWIA
ncbi:MAG: 16S rRNA (cytosine(1402)-N(4))-methyltransferase, partial [Planctomycetota bacterium]